MKISKEKLNKYIIMFICVTFIVSSILVTGALTKNKVNGESKVTINEDDKNIATDISNTTGIEVDKVIKLKEDGLDWNEVLEKCKSQGQINVDNTKEMSSRLASNGLKEDFFKKLIDEGYKEEEITVAKMLVDKTFADINELANTNDASSNLVESNEASGDAGIEATDLFSTNNTINQNSDNGNITEGIEQYKSILEKFDAEKAIYFLLRLKAEFGSYEGVMDEYLCSIQLGVDFEKCISDKKVYDNEKAEKLLTIDSSKLITLQKIAERILEKTQQESKKNSDQLKSSVAENEDKSSLNGGTVDNSKTVELPISDVGNPKPDNPGNDLLNEINDITDRSLNMTVGD